MFVPSEASARSAGISQRAVAPRALSPAGTQCFGVGCGLPGPLPSATNPFLPPRIGIAPIRRDRRVFRHRLPAYGVGFTSYGDLSWVDPRYPALDGTQQIESGPR